MADGFIVRKGGVAEEVLRTAVPSINFISATTTSLTFTFKNNEDAEVDLFFGLTTPPTTKITLAANATSSNQTITGLDDTQNFNVFAYAIVTDSLSKKIKSEIVETQAQTLIPTPTITQVSKTTDSITFTVRNNSRVAADVLYDLVTPPVETTLQLAANTTSANQTITELADNTTFTVFAQTKVAGFADSAIASSSVTTDALTVFTAATGGTTLEYNSGGKRFKSHTFTSNGNFVVSTVGDNVDDRNKVDYLIIAGGGGAGAIFGGAGGAGGFRTTVTPVPSGQTADSKVTITATTHGVTIGAGGTGPNSNRGNDGNNSSVAFANTIIADGGGSGGRGTDNAQLNGNNGGSGGGGGSDTPSGGGSGGSGTSGQGRNGGSGSHVTGVSISGGGGGGAGAVGSNSSGNNGGAGGNGLNNNLRTGSNETRAGGGGGGGLGGAGGVGGSGGSGGGGAGISTNNKGTNGTANTGGGGGGSADNAGGDGGSGIVVIRYEIAPTT